MKIQHLFVLLFIVMGFAACKKGADAPVPAASPVVPVAEVPVQVEQPRVTPTIVILGSSTAQGFGASRTDSCWATKLELSINKEGNKANFINLAYGGYTTYDILPTGTKAEGKPIPDTARNISKALSYQPSLVMISLPSNDVAEEYTNNEIMNNYARLTHLLDSAHVAYIILSAQPRDFETKERREQLKTLNDLLKTTYNEHFDDFFMELSTPAYFIKPEYEFGDGVHINNSGHKVIYNSIVKQPLLARIVQ